MYSSNLAKRTELSIPGGISPTVSAEVDPDTAGRIVALRTDARAYEHGEGVARDTARAVELDRHDLVASQRADEAERGAVVPEGLSSTDAGDKIASGEILPTAVFTEPNTGSDLASLSTRAVKDGDVYRITGQKTWITLGTDANWAFVLARTNKAVKKQEGITFVLADGGRDVSKEAALGCVVVVPAFCSAD